MTTPGTTLMRLARMDCDAVAHGPYTPLVFKPYEFIGGERGILLGYPSHTKCGAPMIVWDHKATP